MSWRFHWMAVHWLLASISSFEQNPSLPGKDLQEVRWAIGHHKDLESKDSIARKKGLTDKERWLLINHLRGEWKLQAKGSRMESDSELSSSISDTRVDVVDLDRDGANEVIVQETGAWGCSPTGNCSLEVLKRSNSGYRVIATGTAQTFSVEEARTNGFRDLVFSMHGSATMSEYRIFRYRAGKYRRMGCYEVDWRPDPDKPDLSDPLITRCG